jgi:hypothetical protein
MVPMIQGCRTGVKLLPAHGDFLASPVARRYYNFSELGSLEQQ